MALSKKYELDLPLEQVFFVGDIHGNYSKLMSALEHVGFRKERGDIVFCTGDLVDGGPENEQCLNLLQEPWFKSALGNHDEMFIDIPPKVNEEMFTALSEWIIEEKGILQVRNWDDNGGHAGGDVKQLKALNPYLTAEIAQWILNGGAWFFDGYKRLGLKARMEMHQRVVQTGTPLTVAVHVGNRRFGVVHAALPSDSWEESVAMSALVPAKTTMLWNRGQFERALLDIAALDATKYTVHDLDALIVGHNIVKDRKPMIRGNTCFMDVGVKIGYQPIVWSAQDVLRNIDSRRKSVKDRVVSK